MAEKMKEFSVHKDGNTIWIEDRDTGVAVALVYAHIHADLLASAPRLQSQNKKLRGLLRVTLNLLNGYTPANDNESLKSKIAEALKESE